MEPGHDELVFHLALGAHHIHEGVDDYELYDWGFSAFGLLLMAAGVALARVQRRASTRTA